MFKEYISNGKRLAKNDSTFTKTYDFWIEDLLKRCTRLFKWQCDIPQKYIELPLIVRGYCGIFKEDNIIRCLEGNIGGKPRFYFDEYTEFFASSHDGKAIRKTIDKDCVIVENDSLRIGFYKLCHKYAKELAHIDVTIINTLVSYRNIIGVPVANTSKQKISITNYQNNLYNGISDTILDESFLGVDFKEINSNKNVSIAELIETRNKVLSKFYNELGIKTDIEKRSNLIEKELDNNNTMLAFNINELLENRQKGCEKINKMFGTNWSVKVSDEINKILEGEYYDKNKSDKSNVL